MDQSSTFSVISPRPPIPSPVAAPRPPAFKVAFRKVFCVFGLLMTLLHLPLIAMVSGAFVSTTMLLRCVAGCYATATLMTLLCVYAFRIFISEKGLWSYNFWGVYREIGWSDIISARRINLLGLWYLRMTCHNSREAIWLPLFLARRKEFAVLIARYTEDSHPLRPFFQPEQ
jgi:hypothetical protein